LMLRPCWETLGQFSYLNAGDEKTLKSIKEIYTLVKQKASNSNNETKVEYKDITKEMPKNFEDFNFLGELKDGVVIFKLPKLIQVSITI
jgi:hypothetical protein